VRVPSTEQSSDDVRFHDPAAFGKLLDQSIVAMRQIPGVQNAAVGLSLPYETILNDGVTLRDGKEAGQQGQTDVAYVTPGYFDTLQMPVLAGRVFTDADGPNAQHVVVVNQAFARKFYGGSNPVGRSIDKDTVIVGEVTDVPISSNLYPVAPLMSEQTIYVPVAQVDAQFLSLVHVWFQPDWVVRTAGPVRGLTAQMQRALASADPNLPTSGFYGMKDLLARTLGTQRIEVALLSAMAALALLLSAVGIFALVANMVELGRPKDARDRHPHGPGLDRRPSNGADWPPWRVGRIARRRSRARPFCRSASSLAQHALWRRRLRCANPGHRGAHPCVGDAVGHNPVNDENCEDRPGH
jgi:macrolide transport system ATP-binding/permease protein